MRKVTKEVRPASPTLVFTPAPGPYMVDHETTSRLCQTACSGSMAPNFRTGARRAAKTLRSVPHLYYAQPFGGRDILGNEVQSKIFVDVTSAMERKERMLACPESQQTFFRAQQGVRDTLGLLRAMAQRAGQRSGFRWAECYRQHLGQGFPQDNQIRQLLGDLVREA